NSHAGIGNFNAQLVARIVSRENRNLAAVRRKFHRVLNQVPKDLLKPRPVGLEVEFFRGQIESKIEVFLFDLGLADLQRITQQLMSINGLEIELHLTLADTCQIEQIIDESL